MEFGRILLKLSGEALAGPEGSFSPPAIGRIAAMIDRVRGLGVQVAVVNGGGNILRGGVLSGSGISRTTADQMGMLATVINSMALQEALESLGREVRLLSAVEMNQVCEPFILRRAVRHLEKGRVIILGGGTGNPYFTTDTAAALRAAEIGARILLKATTVDGVYTADPKRDPQAERLDYLTYEEVLERELGVMDLTAITLCRERRLPVAVFALQDGENVEKLVRGEPVGTLIAAAGDPLLEARKQAKRGRNHE